MDYRKCEECGKVYGYFDSPPADKCKCGQRLVELEDGIDFPDAGDVERPTISC